MIQFFARVVELREEKYVKYDGKVTTDSASREFLEVTHHLADFAGIYENPLTTSMIFCKERSLDTMEL